MGIGPVPVHAVYFRIVCRDGSQGMRAVPGVPDMQLPVVSRRYDMRVLPVPLHLGRPSKPVSIGRGRPPRRTEIPAEDIAVY